MNRLAARPALRALAFALVIVLGAFAAGALSRWLDPDAKAGTVPKVIDLAPPEVRQITVSGADREVELHRNPDGSWTGADGVPPESETLIFTFQDRLFPLPAFRTLRGDASDPAFGLVDPEITLTVTDVGGGDHKVLLGAANFTTGGVYARRGDDPRRIYLVPRRMMDDLRSLLAGRRIDAPNEVPGKLRDLEEQVAERRADKESWWLKQVLEAGVPLPEGLE
ncbi:MAG: DUF4340 domain-containing protein [Acidimicrobiia bacterium]